MLFALVILILLAGLWLIRNGMSYARNLPPGPVSLPIIGALYVFRDKTRRPYELLTDLSKKYGRIFGLQMGSIYTVVLTDPALIREALRRDEYTGRAPLYLTHGIMGGKGLICAEGPLWRDQRKCTIGWLRHLGMVKQPNDKRSSLESRLMTHIRQAVQTVSDACRSNAEGGNTTDLDLVPVLCHNLGNAINDILFGVTYPVNDETWQYLLHLQIEAIEYIGVSGTVNFLPFLRFLPKNRNIMKFILDGKEKTHQIYTKIIRNSEVRLRANNYQVQEPTNILELFLRERYTRDRSTDGGDDDPEFGDDQLNHLLADLFGAGLDTTITTLRWTLLYVALSPEIQKKLQTEFSGVFPDDNSEVTLDHYESLGYLRACIAEAQRIRSVVPMGLPHGTTTETELGGFSIPRHTMVLPLQWAIHMHPDVWPEPDLYKPERFYDDELNTFFVASPQYFMPFQTGKRMCLGDDLAKMLLFLLAGNLLRRFTMQVLDVCAPDQLLKGVDGFTLAPPPHTFRIAELSSSSSSNSRKDS